MRRWNGWGDDAVGYPLPKKGKQYLEERVGPGAAPRDAAFEDVAAAVPESRLPSHPLVTGDAAHRVRHAAGQSLPDWISLRGGQVSAFPDGVAYPATGEEVAELLEFARQSGAAIIPYGGGTSVVGHINPLAGERPVVTVDLGRLRGLTGLDAGSRLATFGAGVTGPDLEASLNHEGFTLGHFPQSFEYSTLGGWIATRSAGQQALGYGRIERLFAGGTVLAPAGPLVLPPFPASAAGPDLREVLLGSEGRAGIITEATVRITPLPEAEAFHAVFLPDFESGMAAARAIVQAQLPLSMIRLSTAIETETTLVLAGHAQLIRLVERYLARRGVSGEKCMLLLGFTGRKKIVKVARDEALAIAREHKGVHAGEAFGRAWRKSRFRTPYLRNTLWETGYAIDTLETATSWDRVGGMVDAVDGALRQGLAGEGERVHVFTHLSHLYPTGSSIYTTYLYRIAEDPQVTLARWRRLKTAASEAIIAHGGTISHQHGIGIDHAAYLGNEKGAPGMAALRALLAAFDPAGMMNPGKML